MKKSLFSALLILSTVSCGSALAGPNDFFGSSIPSGSDPSSSSPSQAAASSVGSAAASPSELTPPSASGPQDYSTDEKRMQKKYREMLKHCELLVAKGDKMMKGAHSPQDKNYKKGKVLKEIGEKQLADFKANSPLPEDRQKAEKAKGQ